MPKKKITASIRNLRQNRLYNLIYVLDFLFPISFSFSRFLSSISFLFTAFIASILLETS